VLILASLAAAMIFALGASSRRSRCQHRTASSSVATMIDFACWALASAAPLTGGVAVDGDSPRFSRAQVLWLLVDDDDVGRCHLVADHRGDGRPALGAVSDDDGVVAHSAPPTLDLNAWRDCVVSVSTVVPIRTIRKAIRSGVMTRTLISSRTA